MNNKRIGLLILFLGVLLSAILVFAMGGLYTEAEYLGCFADNTCKAVESKITSMHFAFGIIGFLLSLGVYLLFFSHGEEAMIKRIERQETKLTDDEKFSLILRALSDEEKQVMKEVKENQGITQSTLRIKIGMSKAKLSYVLSDLEKKGLIKRVKKGKTLAIYQI